MDKGLQGGAGKRDSVRLEDLIYPRSSRISADDCHYLFDTSKSNKVFTFTPEHFFENYGKLFPIPKAMTLKFRVPKNKLSKEESFRFEYEVYYKQVLTGSSARVEIYPDSSVKIIDLHFSFNPTEDFDVTPAITEPEAFELVLKAKPGPYPWVEPYKTQTRKFLGRPALEFYPPKGKLMIQKNRLVYYYYLLTCHRGLSASEITIDAQTGETLGIHNTFDNCHEICDFNTSPSYIQATLPILHD